MREVLGEMVLYGLKDYEKTIDRVIKELHYEHNYFNMKLILTESLSNAFSHGNNADSSKPIYLRYYSNKEIIKLEIEDSGLESKDKIKLVDLKKFSEDIGISERGRGLFLISCFSDNMEFRNNTLIIQINRHNDGKRKGDRI